MRALARTMRFWLVEVWGPGWDWPRRRLLCKHFLAYFRNPAIPTAHLPEPDTAGGLNTRRAEQTAFSRAFRARIDSVQVDGGSGRSRGVFLTYRPLGKNLRLMGTAISENAERGRAVFIEPEGPRTEQEALASRGARWSPWLWSRSGSGDLEGEQDAARAWNVLFRHPMADASQAKGERADGTPSVQAGDGPFNARFLQRVLQVAAATRYVFTPVEAIITRVLALKETLGWPDHGKVLGVHVRRGDAASSETGGAAPTKATRRSFPLTAYLEAADRLCERYGIRHIFLATESRDDIRRAIELRPQYRFLWIDHDRSLFPNISVSPQFIEDQTLERPGDARALATSAIADLYWLSECRAFVGAFNSEFSVLAWLLMVGSKGHLVPYVSLSEPATRRSLHPYTALLNLDNNCPLELYHW